MMCRRCRVPAHRQELGPAFAGMTKRVWEEHSGDFAFARPLCYARAQRLFLGKTGMAGRKAIEKLVGDLYAARKRGDYDAMAEMCAPKATLQLAGAAEHCPVAGTTRGRAALRERFASLAQFAFANQKMLSIMIDGDCAAVHWRAKVTYKPTGKSATTEFCDLWTVRKGKIISAIQFIDTALATQLTM